MCDKVRYATRALAIQLLEEISEKGEQRDKKPTRWYYCSRCGGYHLTSKPMNKEKKQLLAMRKKDKARRLAEQWEQKNKHKWNR